jgi:transposase
VILALDQMRLYFQATVERVWAQVGHTPLIRVAAQRQSVSFYGALNVLTGEEIALSLPRQDSEMTIHFLQHLLTCLPHRPILILWDRASWHTSRQVRDFIQNQPRLEVIYFPVACPDLNPQEQVWKQGRHAVSHNHTLVCLGRLRQRFQDYLDHTLFKLTWIEKYLPPILCEV